MLKYRAYITSLLHKAVTYIVPFSEKNIYFITLTINNWISIFSDFPQTNNVILSSLDFLSREKGIRTFGFVLMRDHMHVLWNSDKEHITDIITAFKKNTGPGIIKILKNCNTDYITNFVSQRRDRYYKIWKSGYGNILIEHKNIFYQKLNYIHMNPTKGDYKSCEQP